MQPSHNERLFCCDKCLARCRVKMLLRLSCNHLYCINCVAAIRTSSGMICLLCDAQSMQSEQFSQSMYSRAPFQLLGERFMELGEICRRIAHIESFQESHQLTHLEKRIRLDSANKLTNKELNPNLTMPTTAPKLLDSKGQKQAFDDFAPPELISSYNSNSSSNFSAFAESNQNPISNAMCSQQTPNKHRCLASTSSAPPNQRFSPLDKATTNPSLSIENDWSSKTIAKMSMANNFRQLPVASCPSSINAMPEEKRAAHLQSVASTYRPLKTDLRMEQFFSRQTDPIIVRQTSRNGNHALSDSGTKNYDNDVCLRISSPTDRIIPKKVSSNGDYAAPTSSRN